MDLAAAQPVAAVPRLAAWLGVLVAAILLLNTAGGWVRLSGSGVAIPHWPLIELDEGRRTLLPPFTAAGWEAAYTAWEGHQAELRRQVEAGAIPLAALGRQPADAGQFRTMFLIEWFHRLLAAGVGVLALSCLGTALRDPETRRSIGAPLTAGVVLIGVQAVLGAMLIGEGTATRWLFVHQGNAALVLACVTWALLRLLSPGPRRSASHAATRSVALPGIAWIELILGGMVASTRAAGIHDSIVDLLHRGNALLLAVVVIVALIRAPADSRQRLSLGVAATFVGVQGILGVATLLLPRGEVLVPLAHQFLGMCTFLVLVLAWYDARHEATA
jgi:heme A synthase